MKKYLQINKPIFGTSIIIACCLLLIACKTEIKQELIVDELFTDHMVLQQETQITIWGTATPMEEVKFINPWGEQISTFAEEDGKWSLKVVTPKAGGPFELKIATEIQSIILKDVLVGEVWLASGQSNMEMSLTGYLPNEPIDNYQEEIANANYNNIRFINIERAISTQPLNKIIGKWTVTTPKEASKFSATAYFFARKLHEKLNVPIGIIHSSWGGTPVEAWMSQEKILETEEFPNQMITIESADTTNIVQFLSKSLSQNVPNDTDILQHLSFSDGDFSNPKFNDDSWSKVSLPGTIGHDQAPMGVEGVFWYRKTFQIDDVSSNYTLHIKNGIDEADVTYINGVKIGNSDCWNCPRKYEIPRSLLKKGNNSIAIRLVNLWGQAGINGDMYLKNGNQEVSIEGDWSFLPISTIINFEGRRKFFPYHKDRQSFMEKLPQIEEFRKLSNPSFPTVLYNAMINPLTSYQIKGVIWYQGESNVGRAAQYNILFPALIQDWRAKWEYELPFYYVQIAPFEYNSEQASILRDAQRKTLRLPKTGMAITMDIGHEKSIHPGNKQDVGSRLSRLALTYDYGVKMVPHGPIYQNHKVDGNTLILNFNGVGSGLMTKDYSLNGFEVAGDDEVFKRATAKILNDKVVVRSWSVSNPVYVRYAWKDYFEGTLFNKEGLPASSFSTEEWWK